MSKPDYRRIQQTLIRAQYKHLNQRISEVARMATQIQQQTGCTRTEALRVAERAIPQVPPVL